MKKTYQTPALTVVKVSLNEIVATSSFKMYRGDAANQVDDIGSAWSREETLSPWSRSEDTEW